MTWVAAGVTTAAVVGGALISSDASRSAANTQANGTREGINAQQQQFAQTRADTAPGRAVGNSSIMALARAMGVNGGAQTGLPGFDANGQPLQDNHGGYWSRPANGRPDVWIPWKGYDQHGNEQDEAQDGQIGHWSRPGGDQPDFWVPDPNQNGQPTAAPTGDLNRKFSISDFWNDPVVQSSYQAGLDLGTKALKNAAPLTTGLDSGAALKELTKFGTDYTGNMAAGSQARFVNDQGNQFNRLAAMAGIGQTAVGTSTSAGMNSANNTSNLIASNANAQGAARIAGANAFSGGMNSIANYWQQQQMLNQIRGQNTGGTNGWTNNNIDV